MWALKCLNGPMAGQIIQLKNGINRIGRSPGSDVQLNFPGISKQHLEIMVAGDKVLLKDLESSNGTFLNGVRIKGTLARLGDKISLHQSIFEVISVNKNQLMNMPGVSVAGSSPVNMQTSALPPIPIQQNVPIADIYNNDLNAQAQQAAPLPTDLGSKIQNIQNKVNHFIENVALPGVYQLPQIFGFRQVIMGFIGVYIVLVTILSVIPMNQITSESIQNESQRRALTVARALASANEKLIRNNDLTNFSTDMVLREEGIDDVYVISKEGLILAPPERAGSAPRETGFARKVRGQPKEFSDHLIDGRITAAVPVLIFDPELQQNIAKAHAIVVYNPGSLAFDDGRVFSLFVQMLFLAFIFGVALFFFLYKLIERPFHLLNNELDIALREGRDQAMVSFALPVLQNLMTNINSLLARAASGGGQQKGLTGKGSRDQEVMNIMQLMGYPGLLIDRENQTVKYINSAFEGLTGYTAEKLVGARLSEIPDPAMQQNFQHLMNQTDVNMNQINTDNLELSGHMFTLSCQSISSSEGEIEYYLITVMPMSETQGGAA